MYIHSNRQDLNDIRSGANNKTRRHTHSLTRSLIQSVSRSFAASFTIHSLPFKSPRIRLSFVNFKYNKRTNAQANNVRARFAIDVLVPYARKPFHRLMTLLFSFMHLLLPLSYRRMSTFMHISFISLVIWNCCFRQTFVSFALCFFTLIRSKRNLNQIYVIRYHTHWKF